MLTNSLRSLPILLDDLDHPIYAIRLGNDDAKSVESSVVKAYGIRHLHLDTCP